MHSFMSHLLRVTQECIITFRYVSELVNEGHNVRLNFPITSLQITPTKEINDLWVEQYVTPPLVLLMRHTHCLQLKLLVAVFRSVKDGIYVDIDVEMPLNIHTVESPSGHIIKTNVTKNMAHIEVHIP